MTKVQVREAARALGLATAEKRDSQEICFVPRGDYRDVLRERGGWTAQPGPVIDVDGRQVGEHFGAASYTIGQRQGTGVSVGEARYVRQIDPVANTIMLGRRADLETRRIEVGDVKFVAGRPPAGAVDGFRAEVQIRHRGRVVPATIRQADEGHWIAETDDPAWAAAPGQAAVFYRGEVVMGGGRIVRPADSAVG
jgi:tRNA-specific 2-thiouridylase